MKTNSKKKSSSKRSTNTPLSRTSQLLSTVVTDACSCISRSSSKELLIELSLFASVSVPNNPRLKLQKTLPNLQEHLKAFLGLAIKKYLQGQLEHGGDFTQDVNHLKEAKNEVIDQWMYLNQLSLNLKKDREYEEDLRSGS